MKLDAALKTSLDELRMQMLGAQVLFGFQFRGLFQDAFESLPPAARAADAAALALMCTVIGLLLAVPSQHRMVENGEATLRIYRLSSLWANYALLPLAAAIACDVYVAMGPAYGARAGAATAGAAFLAATGAWYIVGSILILLITPAAIHRLAFDGRDDPQVHRLGSLIISAALLPLAAAIACDIAVALYKLYGGQVIPSVGASLAALLLVGLWYCVPFAVRHARKRP